MPNAGEQLLSLRGLDISYGDVQAVRGVSLEVASGEIVGIVGESGSGKSSVLRAIAGLLGRAGHISGGELVYKGEDLTTAKPSRMSALRGRELAYVFQDPVASLDPLSKIGTQFDECIRTQGVARGSTIRDLEQSLLPEMGFDDPERVLAAFPHELSGGMCQRVVLAMSLALGPSLLLADEPTSALDVTSQRQISDLLLRIRNEHGCGMLVVSHNIAAISLIADRIGVMRQGSLVEIGTRDQILHAPSHPYTISLIAAVPRPHNALTHTQLEGES